MERGDRELAMNHVEILTKADKDYHTIELKLAGLRSR